MFKKNPEVIVAGAGPVGLFTALRLARNGLEVEILDEQWRTASRSYALALHPESLCLLDELGLLEPVAARSHRIDAVVFHDGSQERLRLELGELQAPFPYLLVIPQRELEEILEEALQAAGARVLWNHRLVEVDHQDDGVELLVERLGKDSTGYGVATTAWVVDKVLRRRASFLVGADGHRSAVRRAARIAFPEVARPQLYGVFELAAAAEPGREMTVVLSEHTNVLWPMGENRCRWSFELFDWEMDATVRRKERVRAPWWMDPESAEEKLDELIASRAPWFRSDTRQVVWSSAVRFERRLAERLVEGRLAVIGDAAHLANPMGVHSMNSGLQEGAALAGVLQRMLRDGASPDELLAWQSTFHHQWRQLLEAEAPPRARRGTDDWVRHNAARILPALPCSGEDLSQLLWQAGLVAPVPVGPAAASAPR